MKEKIGATVTCIPIRASEYTDKMKMLFASNEDFDMCFTASNTSFYGNVQNGVYKEAYTPLVVTRIALSNSADVIPKLKLEYAKENNMKKFLIAKLLLWHYDETGLDEILEFIQKEYDVGISHERIAMLKLILSRALARCGDIEGYQNSARLVRDKRMDISKSACDELQRLTGKMIGLNSDTCLNEIKNIEIKKIPYKEEII